MQVDENFKRFKTYYEEVSIQLLEFEPTFRYSWSQPLVFSIHHRGSDAEIYPWSPTYLLSLQNYNNDFIMI